MSILSALHVSAGAAGLLIGPVAMWAPKRRGTHTALGTLYFAVLSLVCASAAVLAVLRWDTRWRFLPIALGTFAFGSAAYWAARRRPARWLLIHVVGQLSSYTGMVTAFVVNNWEWLSGAPGVQSPLAFFVPMSFGTLATAWLAREVIAGRRPRQASVPGELTRS